jgi:hypothetical protein
LTGTFWIKQSKGITSIASSFVAWFGQLCGVMWRVLILQGIHALACILQINLLGNVGKKVNTFASFKEHYG